MIQYDSKLITPTEIQTYLLLKFLINEQEKNPTKQRFTFRFPDRLPIRVVYNSTPEEGYTVDQILFEGRLDTDGDLHSIGKNFSTNERSAHLITLLEMLYWEDVITYTKVHCPDGYKHPKDIFTLTEDVQNRGAKGVLPKYITIVLRFKAFDLYRKLGKIIAPPLTSDTITFNDDPDSVTQTPVRATLTPYPTNPYVVKAEYARKAAAHAREQAERCLREAEKLNAELYPWHDEDSK